MKNWADARNLFPIMPVIVHVNELHSDPLELEGSIVSDELDIDAQDDAIAEIRPLEYRVTAQMVEKEILVTGQISIDLECECVRCLKRFIFSISIPKTRPTL